LKILSLYLNSSVAKYILFFNSSTLGVSVDKLNPKDIAQISFPRLDSNQKSELEKQFDRFSENEKVFFEDQSHREQLDNFELKTTEHSGFMDDIQNEIDKVVGDILKIPSWMTVLAQEFLQIRFQLKKGKIEETGKQGQRTIVGQSPIGKPSEFQLIQYAEHLRNELDSFARVQHRIVIQQTPKNIIATVEITDTENQEITPIGVKIENSVNNSSDSFLRAMRESRSQWVYVQRNIKYFEGDDKICLIKQNRLLDWTRTQAFLDAGEIIESALSGGK
jgi:hypothetical protein